MVALMLLKLIVQLSLPSMSMPISILAFSPSPCVLFGELLQHDIYSQENIDYWWCS